MILLLTILAIAVTLYLWQVLGCDACSERKKMVCYALTGISWGLTIGWCLI